jgi:hypothetical protein
MKKIIFGSIAVLAIAATIVFNVNLNAQSEKLSDVSLANVEALADGESDTVNYWCCGNSDTCATGKDSNGNDVVIHGKVSSSPC